MRRRVFVVQNPMEARVEAIPAMMSEKPRSRKSRLARAGAWEPVVAACVALNPVLTETLQQFWGVPVRVVFMGAGSDTHYFWRMDDFHVSQLTLGKSENTAVNPDGSAPMALLKLSDTACATFLNRVLGARQSSFSFKRLSPLEANILNELSRDLLSYFKKELIKKPGKGDKLKPVHLIWALQLEGAPPEYADVGKIVLSLPTKAIRTQKPSTANHGMVPDEFFFHVDGIARIYLGSTRVTLADLDYLEPEDLIVLEDSHISRMFVVESISGERIPFQSQIHQQQHLTIPYTQELANMDMQSQGASARQTLWDNLMIEVGAEFEPVKLPLKQLKEMTEGLIVEMGDLVHNRVCLRVEGKVLAWGELVIVGDKFGVRVCKVDAAEQSSGAMEVVPPQEQAAHAPPSHPMPEEAPAPNAEEANLDNFLNEDFDDTFDDDEEEW